MKCLRDNEIFAVRVASCQRQNGYLKGFPEGTEILLQDSNPQLRVMMAVWTKVAFLEDQRRRALSHIAGVGFSIWPCHSHCLELAFIT